MHPRVRADIRAVINGNMPGERSRVCHNDLIADETIVRDVSLGHQEAIITDLRQSPATSSATMDRYELTNTRAAAYYGFCCFSGELQILRRQTDRNKRIYVGLVADAGPAFNYTVRLNDHAIAEYDVGADYGVRTDPAAFADLRARADDRRGMDLN
jgi:hypothetical protein